MTSLTSAVIEFSTSDPVKDCLDRGVFMWDCTNHQNHMLRVEK